MRAANLVRTLIAILMLGLCGCRGWSPVAGWDDGEEGPPVFEKETICIPQPLNELLKPLGGRQWPGDTPDITCSFYRFLYSGQPGEAGLRHAATEHVDVVVNLRTPEEMAGVPFDEEVLVTG